VAGPLPRILIVSDDRRLRAGLRGELRERGYDAVGARNLEEAIRVARPEAGRGPVRLVLVDQSSLGDEVDADAIERLRQVTWQAPVLLIAPGNRQAARGSWTAVIRRPITVGDIADTAARILPDGHAAGPLDV
jgi:ActR/RegA family two-component response regulator